MRRIAAHHSGTVIFVTDPVGFYAMQHHGRGLICSYKQPYEAFLKEATAASPPSAAMSFRVEKPGKMPFFEYDELVSPLTYLGGSSQPELDSGIDWHPSHRF
ncbi:unnamed protein product, partial [Mesorhabditis spiculigera]